MNVMIYNKFKELLMNLNIDVMKAMEGVFNVDEIIDTFQNFYYDKMILDITAIRDYQNTDNIQKLAMNINMENVILLLDDTPESESNEYLSKLVSLGIYNFTRNVDGINYLLVHPHSYKDVANLGGTPDMGSQTNATNQMGSMPNNNMQNGMQSNFMPNNNMMNNGMMPNNNMQNGMQSNFMPNNNLMNNGMMPNNNMMNNGGGMFIPSDMGFENNIATMPQNRSRVIGFKNVTNHAGATSLIYMLKKVVSAHKKVAAIEVNKVDFLYFNDNELVSTTSGDLAGEIMKRGNCSCILVDLNDFDDLSICNEVYYLIEPSTIMINKLLRRNKTILEDLKKEKVVLNKCCLSNSDIATFEYETKLKLVYSIPPCDDRQVKINAIRDFANKINL